MANVTDPLIKSVQGSDPQNLMEYITRQKIYDSRFWKEECFGLTAADVLERAAQSLTCVGGTFGGMGKPTKFLSLTLKLLQLQPDPELVRTFLEQNHFKYLRALGAFYLRLTGRPQDIYELLDPLYADCSKLRYRGVSEWKVLHVDEFIDELLNEAFCCGIAMPRLPARETLQEAGYLDEGSRPTALHDALVEAGGIREYLRRKVDEELRRHGAEASGSGSDNGSDNGSGSGSGSGAIALWEKRYGPLQPMTQPPRGDGVGVDNHAQSQSAGAALPAATGGTIDIQNNTNTNNNNKNNNNKERDNSADLGVEFPGSGDAMGKRKAAEEPTDAAEAKRKKKKKDKKKSEKYGTLFKKSSASDSSKHHPHRNSSNDRNGNGNSNSNSKRSDKIMGGEDGSDSHKAAAAEEHSEEYWNKLRSSLGMNPLKK